MSEQLRCGACQKVVKGTWEDHIAVCEEYRLQSSILRPDTSKLDRLREKLAEARKTLDRLKKDHQP